MTRIRLYVDEDAMRKSLVFRAKARNVNVLTAFDADMINREDEAHLIVASDSSRALYTYNAADFCLLHQQWIEKNSSHSGIIIGAQQRYSSGDELRRLMRLISKISAEKMQDRLEFFVRLVIRTASYCAPNPSLRFRSLSE